jgi:Ca2+-binding RTX toxin-like protein
MAAFGTANVDLTGNAKNNVINGNSGHNAIDGQAGNDRINAGLGNDTLTGGSGADVFHLRGALGAGNIDTITDFTTGEDTIELSDTVFTSLSSPTGDLLTDNFVSAAGATSALDADDYIIHDQTTGALYFDVDGLGGTAAILFGYLQIGATPVAGNNGDFVITS